jgi:hypothetical protein
MKPEELYYMLAGKPFQPVRVHLTDGRQYDIPTRRMAVVGVTFLDIGTQAPNAVAGIWGSRVRVQLDQISKVEPLSLAPSVPTA